MRDFLLRMYAFMKQMPADQTLHAAIAVALAMLEPDDCLAADTDLVPGSVDPDSLFHRLIGERSNPALAVGAALALSRQTDGCVIVAPICSEAAYSDQIPVLLQLAVTLRLPVVFLMECTADFPDDLDAQAALGDIERIQADSQDAMRLMPAIRLGIDKAREGDGPTLIECVYDRDPDDEELPLPAERLADVLITEGYATPEELV